jgi:hypothetical protein
MLLRPQPHQLLLTRTKLVPTWRASSVVFLYSPLGLSADVGDGGCRQLEIGPAAVATLTAPTPRAPSTAAEGVWRTIRRR